MEMLSGSMSPEDCRKAADWMERAFAKLRLRENYPVIKDQVERLAATVDVLRREADEKEQAG